MLSQATIQINLRVTEDLINEIDSVVKSRHYRNRQEVVREALREFFRNEVK
jgi:Arc/MetJ-type ribon-helix-helix transcriptional regulator